MGKKYCKRLYRNIKSDQSGNVTCTTSYYCDNFNSNLNYAGTIVYLVDGRCRWRNQSGGKANGFEGRSFYLIIQSTNNWLTEHLKAAAQGRVHDYLLKNVLGQDFSQNRVACGGFVFIDGTLRFSSIWLNQNDQFGAESDGSKMLSVEEQKLVKYCFRQYKSYGKNHVLSIPQSLDHYLSSDHILSNTYSCQLS